MISYLPANRFWVMIPSSDRVGIYAAVTAYGVDTRGFAVKVQGSRLILTINLVWSWKI